MSLDASDLLDEDGNIDKSMVRSLQNDGYPGKSSVTETDCRRFRRVAHNTTETSRTIGEAFGFGGTTVRSHLTECHHTHDLPACRHVSPSEGWRFVDTLEDDDAEEKEEDREEQEQEVTP